MRSKVVASQFAFIKLAWAIAPLSTRPAKEGEAVFKPDGPLSWFDY